MLVDVYRNLNDDCISVRSRESEDYGTVVSHEECITISDAKFVVQPSGRERCRNEGRKNVHAFVRGKWDNHKNVVSGIPIAYNPFEYDNFVHAETGKPVESAEVARVCKGAVYAEDVTFL